jgi:hypothetical protein
MCVKWVTSIDTISFLKKTVYRTHGKTAENTVYIEYVVFVIFEPFVSAALASESQIEQCQYWILEDYVWSLVIAV